MDKRYYQKGENMAVCYGNGKEYFLNDFTAGHKVMIIDERGNFTNPPPDIAQNDDKLRSFFNENETAMDTIDAKSAKFHFGIESFNKGAAIVVWCVQPDGRYWEDEDGFGGTNESEINLYSVIDKTGRFLLPFRYFESYEDARKFFCLS